MAGRPTEYTTYTKNTSFTLPTQLLDMMQEDASARGVKLSRIVVEALAAHYGVEVFNDRYKTKQQGAR